MIKFSAILLTAYFFAGTLFLPEGDFSTLSQLPKMYQHCKATEDPDMDVPDFITEHLLEVDGLLGHEEQDAKEKPHQPIQFHHQLTQFNFVSTELKFEFKQPSVKKTTTSVVANNIYLSDYAGSVFRPPII